MGRKKLSMSEHIRRYLAKNPQAKAREVAAALGVKVSLVYAIKYKKPKAPSPTLKEVNIDAVHNNTFSVTVPVPPAVQQELFPKAKVHEDVTRLAHNPKDDLVNHPAHYKAGGIETIDFIQAKLTKEEFIGYLKGSALKYASRVGKKGEAEVDAGKMAWYAMKLRDVLNTTA
jgi:hypothetical protein